MDLTKLSLKSGLVIVGLIAVSVIAATVVLNYLPKPMGNKEA